jgi:hypothetical protein
LKVRLSTYDGKPMELLDPASKGWDAAQPTRALLHRTPRVYQTEKVAPSRLSTLEVRALRVAQGVLFRLSWEDTSHNAPKVRVKRKLDAGDSARLDNRPPPGIASFADAAAIMIPDSTGRREFPSLMMGDAHVPVTLYYWNASHGTEQLKAAGRTRVERTGKTFRHQARREADRWTVTMEASELNAPTPVAFAVWDGEAADRNGLKLFSIWYVLE